MCVWLWNSAGACSGQPLDTEDAAVAALRYKSGALGTISSGYYNQGGPKHSHMKIWGSRGWLEMNFEPIANDGAQLNANGSGRVDKSTANPPASTDRCAIQRNLVCTL